MLETMTYKKETAALNPPVATDKAGNIGTGQRYGQNDNGQKSLLKPLRTVSMPELYDTVYASRPPVIDGLLYPGTYILAGAPKLGKSFLMAQMAYHVSTGLPLWGYNARRGPVLYLALEDDYGRLQKRLYRMFGVETSENLYLGTEASSLGRGLIEQLEGFMREHPDTKLMIIDTLQKVRAEANGKYSYAADYQDIVQLKAFTDKQNVCLMAVHHTRKQQRGDIRKPVSWNGSLQFG